MKYVFVLMLAFCVAAGPAEAGLDCSVASTAAIAKLLRVSCRDGRALGSGVQRIVPPPPAIRRIVERVASQTGLEPQLITAVIAAESAFDVYAVSPRNAQGLMQLVPGTAARFGVRDTFDPEDNIRGGAAYLHWLLARFGGNLDLALAAYNAGEGSVWADGPALRYDETVDYVDRVKRFYRLYRHSR